MNAKGSRIRKFRCPWCNKMSWGQVVDSRPIRNGQSRKRLCENCTSYFYTEERVVTEEEAENERTDARRTEDC
jgi:transcriptional regulator NrdR family protein